MKKILKLIIAACVVLIFSSCEKYDKTPDQDKQMRINSSYNIEEPQELTSEERAILQEKEDEYKKSIN